ncbi:MAG: cold-shock protein [Candidatus Tectimicrobiota bacterium]
MTRDVDFIRDAAGGHRVFHRSAVAYPDSFATLEVGMCRVEFESQSDIKEPRATRLTTVP